MLLQLDEHSMRKVGNLARNVATDAFLIFLKDRIETRFSMHFHRVRLIRAAFSRLSNSCKIRIVALYSSKNGEKKAELR